MAALSACKERESRKQEKRRSNSARKQERKKTTRKEPRTASKQASKQAGKRANKQEVLKTHKKASEKAQLVASDQLCWERRQSNQCGKQDAGANTTPANKQPNKKSRKPRATMDIRERHQLHNLMVLSCKGTGMSGTSATGC